MPGPPRLRKSRSGVLDAGGPAWRGIGSEVYMLTARNPLLDTGPDGLANQLVLRPANRSGVHWYTGLLRFHDFSVAQVHRDVVDGGRVAPVVGPEQQVTRLSVLNR